MLKRSVATIIAALSIPVLGGVAIAVANSVDTNPAPASVTHTSIDDNGGLTQTSRTDDIATTTSVDDSVAQNPSTTIDDKGIDAATTSSTLVDDKGGLTGGHGVDDTATTSVTTPTTLVDDHAGVTSSSIDDSGGHGGQRG